ncbi:MULTISPECIES: TetR/AcrR family transcriptional regulator [unclassified Caulobacter]|jgi:AcrR family transcriptional regulator|uniref:TetR/AcrR family transcriptional regulator n=1 Tax=unclassified Caulobacter TaxID=2648921 RepID=UPI0006F3E2AA|nr:MULTISPECIES: TetR/AcrR family transcriptional regulator [unclassified Caulobacter]KQV62456.1 TetR family transcriptional regulator [Caulobacter sp. Root342]KQV65534.1 TetR family transcriptional regulator [Caulobacter sp. Root343]
MQAGSPKWRRRSEARPGEIVQAALEVFAERGFAAAKLDEIAAKAGISKGALYLYFETKEDIFRAVVREAVAPNLDVVEAVLDQTTTPFPDLLRMVFVRISLMIETTRLGAVAKLVIGESRNFPELARVWHDEVVSRALAALSGALDRAQGRGEIRPGNPRLQAFSIMGPILMGVIWQETFTPVGAPALNLRDLIAQHGEAVLAGLAPREDVTA